MSLNNIKSSAILFQMFYCFVFVLFVYKLPLIECQNEDGEIPQVIVQLSKLPQPFSNDNLPNRTMFTNRCLNLFGCFEKLPIMYPIQDPWSLKTEFRVYTHQSQSVIPVEKVDNCLDDEDCDLYPFNLQLLHDLSFDTNKRTVFVIGGYYSKAPSKWETTIKDLWLQIEDVNFVIVSWSGGNIDLYNNAALNTRTVARQITLFLYYLTKLNGLDLFDDAFIERIYMIGHSLGAHIAGFTGQDLNGRIGRITGLEPAGPLFDGFDRRFRLHRSNAQLVDIMHTNSGGSIVSKACYGTGLDLGHIDYYVNDGVHQPGCKSDRTGCSHKKASEYYGDLLSYHLRLKDYLNTSDIHPTYRLFAYASTTFDGFQDGSSLSERCPITVLDDSDLFSADLNRCSIPIDYVVWFDTFKEELKTNYNVKFDLDTLPTTKYFYLTTSAFDSQLDHYIIKIRIDKRNTITNANNTCDVALAFQMAGGLDRSYELKKYKLIDQVDHFEIIVPFIPPTSRSKYEISKLDMEQYYLADKTYDRLRKSIEQTFPTSIMISGVKYEPKPSRTKKVVNFFKRMFQVADDNVEKPESMCSLNIESVAVQPLRKFHRHIVAVYSVKEQVDPKMVVIKDGERSPKTDLLSKDDSQWDAINQKLFIDTLLIGPYDGSIDPVTEPDETVTTSDGHDDNEQEAGMVLITASNTSSNILSKTTWLIFTVLTCSIIILLALIYLFMRGKTQIVGSEPLVPQVVVLSTLTDAKK